MKKEISNINIWDIATIKEQESTRLTQIGNYQGKISHDALESIGTLN